jgi:hypothetical protein
VSRPKKARTIKTFEVLVTCYSVRQARRTITLPVEAESEEEAKRKAEDIAFHQDIEDDEDEYDPTLCELDSMVIRGSP